MSLSISLKSFICVFCLSAVLLADLMFCEMYYVSISGCPDLLMLVFCRFFLAEVLAKIEKILW